MTMKRKKIILVPYPAQGHVTPILKFAAVLSSLGFRPVVIMPEFIHRRISPGIDDRILCHPIPDGLDDDAPRDFFAIERAMEEYMPLLLEKYIRKLIEDEERESGGGIACLVADLLASWAVGVARRCGVQAAGFWPAMHATYRLIAAIPRLLRTGIISENGCPRNPSDPICLSSNEALMLISSKELPWLIGSSSARISRFKFWNRTMERAKTLGYIFMNTFVDEFEAEISESPKTTFHEYYSISSPRVLEIGPLIMQLASTLMKSSAATFWDEDMSCLGWLEKQDVGSVMYISFGSWVSPMGEEGKVRSLALALEALGRPYIWVVGPAWRRGLPDGSGSALGRIVQWAPQLEVLRHPSVGCYLTHCGWNSTMEAIQYRKPLLCYPIAGDQFLNSAYIVNAWKIGTRIQRFGIQEIEDGIREVMDHEVIVRLESLNHKLFGKEGCSKAMANMSTFIKHLAN